MKHITLIILVLTLSACNDPFGATTRTQARSAATIAQADADAREAEAEAEQATVNAIVDAATAANGLVTLLVLGIITIAGIAVYWSGRTAHMVTHQQLAFIQRQALPAPKDDWYAVPQLEVDDYVEYQ